MNKTVMTLATLFGLAAGTSAFAQVLDFDSLDTNQDGAISIEELQVAIPDITPEAFALLDTNGDGVLAPDEFAALFPVGEGPAEAAPTTDAPLLDAPAEPPLLDAPIEEAPLN